eukprot:5691152-Amphidinium_carterae.1
MFAMHHHGSRERSPLALEVFSSYHNKTPQAHDEHFIATVYRKRSLTVPWHFDVYLVGRDVKGPEHEGSSPTLKGWETERISERPIISTLAPTSKCFRDLKINLHDTTTQTAQHSLVLQHVLSHQYSLPRQQHAVNFFCRFSPPLSPSELSLSVEVVSMSFNGV